MSITKEELKKILKSMIRDDEIVIYSKKIKYKNKKPVTFVNLTIKIDVFLEMFRNEFPNYSELIAKSQANNLGWEKYFNEWKDKGIIQ